MHVRWMIAFLDFPASEFGPGVAFWRAIAGCTVSPPRGQNREFASLEPFNGDAHLAVQRLQSSRRGLHVDLHVDDLPQAVGDAAALGAAVVAQHHTHAVLSSPAGQPFCLVPFGGSARRSRPIRWAEDTISAVDRVCLDVPEAHFDTEAGFWSALTEHALEPDATSVSHERTLVLRRDPRLALGIVLRRSAAPEPTALLDVAATSVPNEVARHINWGARLLDQLPSLSVMSDPAGRRYHITGRSPRTGR